MLDIGCGTGTFACLLAQRGKVVIGVDPAVASLDVARRKPGADAVRWVAGDATSLPPLQVDLVTMTGNVAQVFLTDDDWASTLRAVRSALRPGGWFVFEVRDPAREAWLEWNREQSYRRHDLPTVGPVETWVDLTDVSPPFVSFRWTFIFETDGTVVTSDSTLGSAATPRSPIRSRPRNSWYGKFETPRTGRHESSCSSRNTLTGGQAHDRQVGQLGTPACGDHERVRPTVGVRRGERQLSAGAGDHRARPQRGDLATGRRGCSN